MANVSLVLDHHLFLMAHRFEAPENPGTTIYAGTANTDSTGATDNRGYGIGGNRGEARKQLPKFWRPGFRQSSICGPLWNPCCPCSPYQT